jgi:agmatinase
LSSPGGGKAPGGGGAPALPGIRTYAGLPHRKKVDGYDVAIVGAPWDGGASHRPGGRFGPEAIRRASTTLEPYHPTHGIDVFEAQRALDWGDIEMIPGDATRSYDEVEGELTIMCGAGVTPIVLGGDHTVLEAELSALASVVGPVGLVLLDAHTDSLEEPDEDRTSRGGAVRRAVLQGLVRPDRSILAGMRGPLRGPEELGWPAAVGFDLVVGEELERMDAQAFADRVRGRIGRDVPALLSIDLDVVDPAFAPGTGTPEIGGLTSGQLLSFIRGLSGIPFAGYDVAELVPPFDDVAQSTARLAAVLVYEFLALAAMARRGR